MKQDRAEAQAIANAMLQRLQAFPIIDQPHAQCLAPDLVLLDPVAPRFASTAFVGPPEKGIPMRLRPRFAELREHFANKAGNTTHSGVMDAEWARMPLPWRIVMLMMGGIGDLDADMHQLAARSWQLIPPKERDGIRSALREAYMILSRVQALRLRTID
ncbi:hypothetical protein ABIE32_001839 [Comamonas sp. 4034]